MCRPALVGQDIVGAHPWTRPGKIYNWPPFPTPHTREYKRLTSKPPSPTSCDIFLWLPGASCRGLCFGPVSYKGDAVREGVQLKMALVSLIRNYTNHVSPCGFGGSHTRIA